LVASTFGAAGFNRHLIHHWDPQLSYTVLPEVEKYLMNTIVRDKLIERKTSYIKTFVELWKQK
jgi:fatty acid desaturase